MSSLVLRARKSSVEAGIPHCHWLLGAWHFTFTLTFSHFHSVPRSLRPPTSPIRSNRSTSRYSTPFCALPHRLGSRGKCPACLPSAGYINPPLPPPPSFFLPPTSTQAPATQPNLLNLMMSSITQRLLQLQSIISAWHQHFLPS